MVAIITALAILPSCFADGWVTTFVVAATIYPLFLLGWYVFVGWRVAGAAAGQVAAPRGRAALLLGSGAACALTLAFFVTTLVCAAVAGFATWSRVPPDLSEESLHIAESTAYGLAIGAIVALVYLLATIAIGFPCTWLGAWLALRRRPALTADEHPE